MNPVRTGKKLKNQKFEKYHIFWQFLSVYIITKGFIQLKSLNFIQETYKEKLEKNIFYWKNSILNWKKSTGKILTFYLKNIIFNWTFKLLPIKSNIDDNKLIMKINAACLKINFDK